MKSEEHLLQFYEWIPSGGLIELDDSPGNKPDFARYTVELRCQNPITDTRKTLLPPLEELGETTETLLASGLKPDKVSRKDLLKLLQITCIPSEWFLAAQIKDLATVTYA